MTEEEKQLVKSSWAKVLPIADTAASLFYGKLFELDPSLKPLFQGDMKEQGAKLMKTIGIAVNSLDRLDQVVPVVKALGKKHKDYGVLPTHYDTVASALLDTLAKGLGDGFTPDTKVAWTKTYGVLSTTMIEAAEY